MLVINCGSSAEARAKHLGDKASFASSSRVRFRNYYMYSDLVRNTTTTTPFTSTDLRFLSYTRIEKNESFGLIRKTSWYIILYAYKGGIQSARPLCRTLTQLVSLHHSPKPRHDAVDRSCTGPANASASAPSTFHLTTPSWMPPLRLLVSCLVYTSSPRTLVEIWWHNGLVSSAASLINTTYLSP